MRQHEIVRNLDDGREGSTSPQPAAMAASITSCKGSSALSDRADDLVALKADCCQRRGFEPDQIGHFHGETRRGIDDTGRQVGIVEFFSHILVRADCRRGRSGESEPPPYVTPGKRMATAPPAFMVIMICASPQFALWLAFFISILSFVMLLSLSVVHRHTALGVATEPKTEV